MQFGLFSHIEWNGVIPSFEKFDRLSNFIGHAVIRFFLTFATPIMRTLKKWQVVKGIIEFVHSKSINTLMVVKFQ